MQQGEGRAESENCFNLSPLGTGFRKAQAFNAAVPGAASRGRAAHAQPVTQSLGIAAKRRHGGTRKPQGHIRHWTPGLGHTPWSTAAGNCGKKRGDGPLSEGTQVSMDTAVLNAGHCQGLGTEWHCQPGRAASAKAFQ